MGISLANSLGTWTRAMKASACEQLRCRPSPRLILEIDIGERLSAVVTHDKAGGKVGGKWQGEDMFPANPPLPSLERP
jgi:hypothetical protein